MPYICLATNNQAEYWVLIKGLELARKHTTGQADCYSDSQLVVNQMNEVWKVNAKLRPLEWRMTLRRSLITTCGGQTPGLKRWTPLRMKRWGYLIAVPETVYKGR